MRFEVPKAEEAGGTKGECEEHENLTVKLNLNGVGKTTTVKAKITQHIERSGSTPNLDVTASLAETRKPSASGQTTSTQSDVTKSDDEEIQLVAHADKKTIDLIKRERHKASEGRIQRGKKKIEKKHLGKKIAIKKDLRPLLPGEVVWAKIPSYPWWPAQVRSHNNKELRKPTLNLFRIMNCRC